MAVVIKACFCFDFLSSLSLGRNDPCLRGLWGGFSEARAQDTTEQKLPPPPNGDAQPPTNQYRNS